MKTIFPDKVDNCYFNTFINRYTRGWKYQGQNRINGNTLVSFSIFVNR